MLTKRSRIIVDTNLWISYLISKGFKSLDRLIFDNQAVLIFSSELIDEFVKVSKRKKFSNYFNSSDIKKLLLIFDSYGEIVKVTSKISACRDSKDNFLLSLSVDGKADYLITGDDDLLELKTFKQTRILKISDFEKIL